MRPSLTTMAAAALLLGGTALAQTDMEQLQLGMQPGSELDAGQIATPERRAADEVPQVAPEVVPGDLGDRARIESIAPAGRADVRVEQPEGRDLCDPGVPESERRRAGVDCERELSVNGDEAPPAPARDPLLSSEEDGVGDELESLGLDEDVPPTFILQQ